MYRENSVLISTWPCNHCSEENKLYLDLREDGGIEQRYEGCGGMMGRNWELSGKNVDRDKAISELEERIRDLYDAQRELEENLQEAEEVLEILKRSGQASE